MPIPQADNGTSPSTYYRMCPLSFPDGRHCVYFRLTVTMDRTPTDIYSHRGILLFITSSHLRACSFRAAGQVTPTRPSTTLTELSSSRSGLSDRLHEMLSLSRSIPARWCGRLTSSRLMAERKYAWLKVAVSAAGHKPTVPRDCQDLAIHRKPKACPSDQVPISEDNERAPTKLRDPLDIPARGGSLLKRLPPFH
ncbi:hypothetical protein CONLIGDRAFT_349427 [Coniochaeta ligniaria NRRL 30616]|uniref:Uncharacterized protein n=1 Tax=Coniochaeta ligniaria NRRL 30616 TaxID=1408157 RepID=A0A1J7JKU0_9PEZI|nr:hypothetical protein CONLIGDRAFT_349427 [Coniochaeta ligniaria NRRL 30616]